MPCGREIRLRRMKSLRRWGGISFHFPHKRKISQCAAIHYFTFGMCRIFHRQNTPVGSSPHRNLQLHLFHNPSSYRVFITDFSYGHSIFLCKNKKASFLTKITQVQRRRCRCIQTERISLCDRQSSTHRKNKSKKISKEL